MPVACIDIGSNTTRLLVAERAGEGLRELLAEREFTKLGSDLRQNDGAVSAGKLRELAAIVTAQARLARDLGVTRLRAVATAAVRQAVNCDQLIDELNRACGIEIVVLTEHDEARLSFVGATRMLDERLAGRIAIVDVGGGSTEIAIGTIADGVEWDHSYAIGSGWVADEHLASDPPTADQLSAARTAIRTAFDGVTMPPAANGIAIGGSASSLRRMVGAVVDHDTLERAVSAITRAPAHQVAGQFDLVVDRVRMLPAGVMILEEASDRLGLPLRVGNGGLREGVVLELFADADQDREVART